MPHSSPAALPKSLGQAMAAHPRALGLVLVLALAVFRTWAYGLEVWQTGIFHDTDDAMRMVQVRNWMAGQGWFDLTVAKVNPSHPLVMHWTRVVDLAVAGLIWLFGWVASPQRAEILARLILPLGLNALFTGLVGTIAARLNRHHWPLETCLVAMVGTLFLAAELQFIPGRIHHHAPQIVLLVCFVGGLLTSFEPASARRTWGGVVMAASAALSVAIGLENLPFFAIGGAGLVVAWICDAPALRPALRGLAGGLLVGLPLACLATVGSDHWRQPVCDAFSISLLAPGFLGALGLAGLAVLTPKRASWRLRLGAALGLGGVVVGVFALGFPQCLQDPLSSHDPLIALWLRHISEGMPLPLLWATDKLAVFELFVPNGLAVAAAIFLAVRAPADVAQRAPWLVLAALIVVGIAGGCWEIRVDSSTSAISIIVGAVAAVRLAHKLADPTDVVSKLVWATMALLPFTQLPELVVGTGMSLASTSTATDEKTCTRPADFAGLQTLPPSLLFNPIDTGSYLLIHTEHAVLAASYHRAIPGNRRVLHAFLSPVADAESDVRQSGARYLIFCPAIGEVQFYKNQAPQGLAADLLENRIPDWLKAEKVPGPYQIFSIVP